MKRGESVSVDFRSVQIRMAGADALAQWLAVLLKT